VTRGHNGGAALAKRMKRMVMVGSAVFELASKGFTRCTFAEKAGIAERTRKAS
jgi:hypothetical protein